jgi:hypothetical protein
MEPFLRSLDDIHCPMTDATLIDLFAEIRGALLRTLSRVDERGALWTPAGLSNHAVWHAGHAYVVVECLTAGALGREAVVPTGWFELFSWESRPGTIPAERFPPLATVVRELESQFSRLSELFASLGEVDLKGRAVDQTQSTVRQVIVHALQDEASHKGEIWLLRKLFALQNEAAN